MSDPAKLPHWVQIVTLRGMGYCLEPAGDTAAEPGQAGP